MAHYFALQLQKGFHVTLIYRDDCSEKDVHEIQEELCDILSNITHVIPYEQEMLADGKGNENKILTYKLKLKDDQAHLYEELERVSQKWSYRNYLDEQYPFKFHMSIGNKDDERENKREEYHKNLKNFEMLGGIGTEFGVLCQFSKNMTTKVKTNF